jgi:hypothetical protein
MISSQSSHFPSLILTAIQRGAFKGLLPGHESMDDWLTKLVSRLAKPTKPTCRKAFVTDNSDDTDNAVRSKGKVKILQSAVDRVCLRYSKRLHLAGELTARGKTVPTGFHCDLSRFRKYSYCAQGHHDYEDVG